MCFRKIYQNTSHIWAFGMIFSHLCYIPEAERKVKEHETLSTRPTTHWDSVSELSGFADMRNLAEWLLVGLQLDSFWEHYPSSLCWQELLNNESERRGAFGHSCLVCMQCFFMKGQSNKQAKRKRRDTTEWLSKESWEKKSHGIKGIQIFKGNHRDKYYKLKKKIL